jgi:hypothetical protein
LSSDVKYVRGFRPHTVGLIEDAHGGLAMIVNSLVVTYFSKFTSTDMPLSKGRIAASTKTLSLT